jgi:16S rRNA (cytosine967-C5)-methyltransferase
VQHALIAGDARTGASVSGSVPELDAGDVFAMRSLEIAPDATAGRLLDELAIDGADLLAGVVDAIAGGTAAAFPQQGEPTFAPKLGIDDARLDWAAPADVVRNRFRGVTPEPGAWTTLDDQRLKVLELAAASDAEPLAPGESCASTADDCSWAPERNRSSWSACSREGAPRCPRPTGGAVQVATAWWHDERAVERRAGAGRRDGRGRGPGTRPRATSASRPRGLVAFEVLEAVRDDEAYANLLLPSRIRRAGLDRADAAFATELTYGTAAHAGLLRRGHRPRRGPPHERDRPGRARRAQDRHPPAPRHPGAHARRGLRAGRDREAGGAEGAGFANAVLRRSRGRRPRRGATSWPRGRRATMTASPGSRAIPEWIVARLRRALAARGRGDELERLLAADNASPRVNLACCPGSAPTSTTSGLDPTGTRRSGVGRRPDRASPRSSRARPGAGRGIAARRARADRAPHRAAGGALARPLRRPGGKTAVLAAEALSRWRVLVANEMVPARAELVRKALVGVPTTVEVHVATAERSTLARSALPAGSTASSSTRRAPGSARSAAAPRRGGASRPRRRGAHELQGELFDAAVRALAARRRARVRDLLAAHRGDPREPAAALERWRRTRRAARHARVVQGLSRHPLDLAGAPETCSCGRTGTAPTPCSSRWCVAPSGCADAVDADR